MKETEEIRKGNNSIVVFLGWELKNGKFNHSKTFDKGLEDKRTVKLFNEMLMYMDSDSKLSFHCNWSDLMDVVLEIEKIQLPFPALTNVKVEIKGNSCRIFKGEWNDSKEGFISYVSYAGNKTQYTKIEATYLAVVDFVKWYNQNKYNISSGHSVQRISSDEVRTITGKVKK